MPGTRQEVEVINGLGMDWVHTIGEAGKPDMVPLGLIAAGLVVAVLAVVWLLPRSGGKKAGASVPVRKSSGGSTPGVDPQLAGELGAHAERLERLLVEAREVISRLEGLGTRGEVEPKAGFAPTKSMDELTARVYDLADAGQTPVEIAQGTGQQTGQVELILALRR